MSNSKTDCSVIIPAYNAEGTIARAVESLFSGALGEYRIEVLVIDDGSVDSTARIAAELEKKYPSVRLLQKENGGVSSARNRGLSEALGRFVFFMDADDEAKSDALNRLIRIACETGADIVIADYEKVELSDGSAERVRLSLPAKELLCRDEITQNILRRFVEGNAEGFSQLWNKLYVRERIASVGTAFDERRTHGEDWDFNIRCFDAANTVYYEDTVLYRYFADGEINISKYKKGLVYGYIEGYRQLTRIAEKYRFYSLDKMMEYRMMNNAAFRFVSLLRMEEVPQEEKRALLRTEEVKRLFQRMAKLDSDTLYALSLSGKDRLAFRLLSAGLYRNALRIL